MSTLQRVAPTFETFSRSLLSSKSSPYVSILKCGIMSLNRSAHLALGAPRSVELLYDRVNTVVGLRAIDSRADNAYHLRSGSKPRSGPYLISAMAFTRFYDIDTSVTKRWLAIMVDDVLCVDLSAPGTPVSSKRGA